MALDYNLEVTGKPILHRYLLHTTHLTVSVIYFKSYKMFTRKFLLSDWYLRTGLLYKKKCWQLVKEMVLIPCYARDNKSKFITAWKFI